MPVYVLDLDRRVRTPLDEVPRQVLLDSATDLSACANARDSQCGTIWLVDLVTDEVTFFNGEPTRQPVAVIPRSYLQLALLRRFALRDRL